MESLCKLRIRESHPFKTLLEVYDMDIHLGISMFDLSKNENDGEEKHR